MNYYNINITSIIRGICQGMRLGLGVGAVVSVLCILVLATPTCYGQSHLPHSHWILTEQGLITPMMDSPFNMMLPNDLMSFLAQEKRLSEINSLYQSLLQKKFILDSIQLPSPNHVAAQLLKKNANCKKYGIALSTVNLYVSMAMDGSDRSGIQLVDFFGNHADRTIEGSDTPDCKRITKLPFSMKTFEHFKPMVNRRHLVSPTETPLRQWLLPGTNLKSFGHLISQGLRRNSTSWLHYNLASIYWRIKGEAYNAIECSRRAVHFAPREFKDITLFNLGQILHMTRNPVEAAIVLHSAIDHNPHYMSHFALGNTYAVLEDFNRSVNYYNHCLKIKSGYLLAVTNRLSVLCHEKYLTALMNLLDSIRERRAQFELFQTQYERWLKLEEKALFEQVPVEYRFADKQFRHSDHVKNTHSCIEKPSDDLIDTSSVLFCQIINPSPSFRDFESRQARLNPMDILYDLQKLSKDIELESTKFTTKIPLVVQLELQKEYDFEYFPIRLQKYQEMQLSRTESPKVNVDAISNLNNEEDIWPELTTNKQKYPSTSQISRIKHDFDKSSNWPSSEECKSWKSDFPKYLTSDNQPKDLLHIYLPLENKGFNITAILTDFISLNVSDEHPLPWYPPVCPSALEYKSKRYLPADIVSGIKSPKNFPPSQMLSNILQSYLNRSKHTDEAEIGQRILTAMNKKTGPKWVLYTLASLYWRVRGNTHNAIDCLLNALEDFDPEYKDAILVSLASVLHQLGYVPDAFEITFEAFAINKIEPATNFLLSLLHSAIDNPTGQMYHLKQTVRADEHFMDGWPYVLLKAWHCQSKFPAIFAGTSNIEDPDLCSGSGGVTMSSFRSDSSEENSSLGQDSKGMICTAGNELCNSDNIHCYKADAMFKNSARKPGTNAEDAPFNDLLDKLENMYSSVSDLADVIDGSSKKLFESEVELKNAMERTAIHKYDDLEKLSIVKKTVTSPPTQKHYKVRISPMDNFKQDESDIDSEIGNLIVSVDASKSEEILHVHDKFVSFDISNDLCIKHQPKSDLVNLLTAFEKRDFYPNLKNLVISRYPASNTRLKPKCLAPQFDLYAQMLGGETLFFPYQPSPGFIDILRQVTGDHRSSLQTIGIKIAEAMKRNSSSWIIHLIAALFWKVEGNSEMMVNCIRLSLHLAPEEHKDVPTISLAAAFHWLGSVERAISLAYLVYQNKPEFSINPFFVGLMHATMGEYEQSIYMYRKAISLDDDIPLIKNFLREILCLLLFHNGDKFSSESIFL